MLYQSLEMGGAERQGLYLAHWLRVTHGVDVEVWGLTHPGSVRDWCDAHNLPWRFVPWDWNRSKKSQWSGIFRLLLELRRAKADVLLPYTMPPNIIFGVFWRMGGAKTCIWSQRDDGLQRFAPWLERYAVSNTPWFVSNSSHGADFLSTELGVFSERIEVIHNGIELMPPKLGRDEWRSRLGVLRESLVACMVANLHKLKDHSTLLLAWRLVTESCSKPSPILLLAGHDYGIGQELRVLAGQLGIADNVLFLGHVDDISGLLLASDIGVFSSFTEGVPNGVLECMAAGLPVVATDIPGTREALGNDNEPFLVETGNPADMAKAVLRLLSDKELRQTVGTENLERVRTEFSKKKMCERYCQTIAKALNIDTEKNDEF